MRFRTFLPRIMGNADIAAQGEPVMTPNAFAFVDAWLQRLGDRADMVLDSRLCQAAQKHASWLDANNVRERRHYGEGGSTPNERARAEGFRLPEWYSAQGNQIESVGECYDGAVEALRLLLDSPPHRAHLLRENDFFATHEVYGVGVSGKYYVVLTAPREWQENGKRVFARS